MPSSDPEAPITAPPHRKFATRGGGPRQSNSVRLAARTGTGLVRLVFSQPRLASPAVPFRSESPPHSVPGDSKGPTAVSRAVSNDRPIHSERILASTSQTGDAHLVSTLCARRTFALRNITALPLGNRPAQDSLSGFAIERSGGANRTGSFYSMRMGECKA